MDNNLINNYIDKELQYQEEQKSYLENTSKIMSLSAILSEKDKSSYDKFINEISEIYKSKGMIFKAITEISSDSLFSDIASGKINDYILKEKEKVIELAKEFKKNNHDLESLNTQLHNINSSIKDLEDERKDSPRAKTVDKMKIDTKLSDEKNRKSRVEDSVEDSIKKVDKIKKELKDYIAGQGKLRESYIDNIPSSYDEIESLSAKLIEKTKNDLEKTRNDFKLLEKLKKRNETLYEKLSNYDGDKRFEHVMSEMNKKIQYHRHFGRLLHLHGITYFLIDHHKFPNAEKIRPFSMIKEGYTFDKPFEENKFERSENFTNVNLSIEQRIYTMDYKFKDSAYFVLFDSYTQRLNEINALKFPPRLKPLFMKNLHYLTFFKTLTS